MSKKFLGWMAAAVGVLFATACSNDEMLSAPSDPYVSGEEVTVSFTISSEGKTPAINRAGEAQGDGSTTSGVHYPEENEFAQISDGSKAKKLIYAVYNDNYDLLEQYGDNDNNPDGAHYGQAIMDIETFPVTISLRLMRNQTYHIAFWAQDAECDAYDTNDLTMVEVKYTDANGKYALNNDESRDAFCKTESFTVSSDDQRTVILKRPLAQINVGTAGYDYEAAVGIATTPTNGTDADTPEAGAAEDEKDQSTTATGFLYSKIELKGVAKYFDVLHNKVLTDDDLTKRGKTGVKATQDVTYDWARIPAYVNYDADKLPANYPSIDKPNVTPLPTTLEGWNSYYRQFKEQFLRVRFYEDDANRKDNEPYLPYISKDETSSTLKPNDGIGFSPNTETFKYLSMCYVLVPDYVNSEGTAYNTTLESVTVWMNNKAEDTDALQLGNNIFTEPTVKNVPVQRNWRTNIFGKNLLTLDYTPNILIDANFAGEYNKDGDNDWESGDDSSNYPKKDNDNGDSNDNN